jgi:hypothetical protein
MKQYVPVEPTVNAAIITGLSVVTTATLDDGTTAIVPNTAIVGDALIQQVDGSLKLDAQADFLAHYKAA